MNGFVSHVDISPGVRARAHGGFVPSLELRRRSSDHPMAMFSLAAGAAFLSMAFVPSAGTSFASFGQPARVEAGAHTTAKTSRLPARETDFACRDPQDDGDVCVMKFAGDIATRGRFATPMQAAA